MHIDWIGTIISIIFCIIVSFTCVNFIASWVIVLMYAFKNPLESWAHRKYNQYRRQW